MRGLESAVEWLRPLVETKAWDYCVVWKLGDDPSRFIKWMDCCCCGGGGGGYGHSNVKVETGGEHHLPPFCRDVHFQHRIRTKACEALARFPSSMPLYSGIHGEVAISAQPRWLNHANVSDSNPSHASLKHSIGKSSGSKKPKYDENLSKQQMGLVLGGGNHVVEKDNVKVIRRPEREQYQSKNLVLERNRRNRIKDGLFALRAIVPKISKMDRVSILGDAAEYIGELQKKVKELQDDLKEMEEEDCNKNNAELKISKLNGVHGGGRYSPANKHKQVSSIVGEKKQMEVQVEVNQIGNRDFLLKFFCEEKRGGFARLVEAMNSLGVQVVDANVTTFNGKVLNILKVEANKEVQPKKLRDSLIKLTG